MKYICFSLYGSNPLYHEGLIRNLKSIQSKLEDYVPLVYVSKALDKTFIEEIRTLGAVVEVEKDDWPQNGMFWRFQAIFNTSAERILVRDCDSDVLLRDVAAIRAWEKSELAFHIMRDHPLHAAPIMGGMWGAKVELVRSLFDKNDFKLYLNCKGQDQDYLALLYPKVKNVSLIHDSFFKYEKHSISFPSKRLGNEFIGETLNELGLPISEDSRNLLSKVEQSVWLRFVVRYKFKSQMMKLKLKHRLVL